MNLVFKILKQEHDNNKQNEVSRAFLLKFVLPD